VTTIPWYFDPISPFAYLAWKRLQALNLDSTVQPRPILFAGLLDHHGNVGPAEIPSKRRFTYRMVQWRAEQQRVELNFPPSHPFNPLPALRLVIAAGASAEAVSTLLDFVWAAGRDPSQPAEIAELSRALGIADPAAAISDPQVKQRLRDNFEAAVSDQVFGVPTVVFRGNLYWGDDSVDMLATALANPERFESSPYSDVDSLPIGIARKTSAT